MENTQQGLTAPKGQIKSKERVSAHGEVFTADREVNAMLDLVKQETEHAGTIITCDPPGIHCGDLSVFDFKFADLNRFPFVDPDWEPIV